MNTIPPAGHYLKEWLQTNRRSQAELAVALNHQEPFVSKIVNGKAHITPKLAVKLETITQIPALTWLQYEAAYMVARARQQVQ